MDKIYKEFERDLLYFAELSFETEDPEELIKIESTIEILRDMQGSNQCTLARTARIPNKRMMMIELTYMYENFEVLKYINNLAKTSTLEESDKKYPLSEQEMFDYSFDFFNTFKTPEIRKSVNWLYTNKKFLYHIEPKITLSPEATTIHLWYFNEPHIFLSRSGLIADYANLSHETAHAIEDMLNYNLSAFDDKQVFSELISSIFEVSSLIYLKTRKEGAKYDLIRRLNDFLTKSKLCMMESTLLEKNANNIPKITPRTIRRDTEEIMNANGFKDYQIDPKCLLEPYLSKYLSYNFGFLLALDIAYIYHEDKNAASDIINRLLHLDWSLPYNEFLSSITDIITPGSHTEDLKTLILK